MDNTNFNLDSMKIRITCKNFGTPLTIVQLKQKKNGSHNKAKTLALKYFKIVEEFGGQYAIKSQITELPTQFCLYIYYNRQGLPKDHHGI